VTRVLKPGDSHVRRRSVAVMYRTRMTPAEQLCMSVMLSASSGCADGGGNCQAVGSL